MALSWPNKDPEEYLDYPVDFSAWVVSPAAIDSATCVVESQVGDDTASPLVIELVQFGSNIVNVWLSGGVSGVKYVFKVTATDNNVTPADRVGVRRVKLTVKDK
jgi:hypothetical protein